MKFKWLLVLAATMTVGCEPAPTPKADKPPSGGSAAVKESTAAGVAEVAKPESGVTEKELSPLEQVVALSTGFSAEMEKWMVSARAAKPDERAALMKSRPDPMAVSKAIKALAEGHDDPAVRFESLMFDAQNLREETAMLDLVKNHAANEKVVPIVMMLGRSRNPEAAKDALGALVASADNTPAKGAALFALATMLEEEDPTLAEQYLEKISTDFAALEINNKKLVDLAAPMLFAIKNLGIGKVAPDIEGTDFDSVAFKLSDYRGKVVVLDFWGDW